MTLVVPGSLQEYPPISNARCPVARWHAKLAHAVITNRIGKATRWCQPAFVLREAIVRGTSNAGAGGLRTDSERGLWWPASRTENRRRQTAIACATWSD